MNNQLTLLAIEQVMHRLSTLLIKVMLCRHELLRLSSIYQEVTL